MKRSRHPTQKQIERAGKLFRDRSWGREPTWKLDVSPADRPDLPVALTCLGDPLIGFVVQTLQGKPRSFAITSDREVMRACVVDPQFAIPKKLARTITYPHDRENILAFVGQADRERLYVHLADRARRQVRKKLYAPYASQAMSFRQINRAAPGLHSRDRLSVDFPAVCLGAVTFVIYQQDKVGDGLSTYVHEMGEEGGDVPWLCVCARGDFHFAGGDYTVPTGGIAN